MHAIETDATLKLAKTTLRSGKVPEAEAMYRKVLDGDPNCAEAIHFLGLAAMQRGKLDEALELVRKSIELEPKQADYHNNLATALGRMNRSVEALGASQQAIDLKADFPEAYGNKGVALEQLGRVDEAIDAYRKAADLKSDHVDALVNLGNALSRKGEHEEAIKCLKKYAELRPRNPDARKHLGNACRRAGKAEQAVTAYRMAVEINPKDADAYNNLGAALQESGRVPEAEEALRTCLSIKPDHSDAHWNRGLALLAMGQWREGWMEYEWRQHLKEDVGQRRTFPQPVWKGSPLEGRTLLVLCEQGLGDTIQFIRYAPLLAKKGAKVIVECQSKLRPLLQGLPGVEKVIAKGEPLPKFDMHARLMTLPVYWIRRRRMYRRRCRICMRRRSGSSESESCCDAGMGRSAETGMARMGTGRRSHLMLDLSGKGTRLTRATDFGRSHYQNSRRWHRSKAFGLSACRRGSERSRLRSIGMS